jgi:hypothetical protein
VRGRRGTRPTDAPKTVGWLALWLLVAAVVVIPHLFAFTQLSPVDEYQHVDYLDKTQRLELVNGGELVDETAMREQACRGIDLEGYQPPPCDSPDLEPEQFPGAGFNHTYGDPPTYYAITGLIAAGLEQVPGIDSLVTAGRLVGVLWLWGGLSVTFFLAVGLGARRWAAVGATLLVATSMVVVESSATITTDAPALLVGGLLCLVALAVVEGRCSPWWLVPAGVLATAIKPTNVCVVGAALVFLLLQGVPRRGDPSGGLEDADPVRRHVALSPTTRGWSRPALLPVVILLLAAAIPAVLWSVVTRQIETPAVEDIPMFDQFASNGIRWYQLADNLLSVFTPVKATGPTYVPAFLYTSTIMLLTAAGNLVLVVGLAGVAWFRRWNHQSTKLAVATTLSMILSGPVLVVLIFVSLDSYYSIPPRYGLSLVAPAAASLAVAASRRSIGGIALMAFGVVSGAVLLSHTL